MKPTLVHTGRDEAGPILYERLDSFTKGSVYFRRRPGQSRQEITEEEYLAALLQEMPEPDPAAMEPAGVYENPAFGPRRRL